MLDASVTATESALEQMRAISSKVDYRAVRKALVSLEDANEAYPRYAPAYDAAPSPVPCRVCPAGRYAVYYVVIDGTVVVFDVEDARRDSQGRFEHIDEDDLLEQALADAVARVEGR